MYYIIYNIYNMNKIFISLLEDSFKKNLKEESNKFI